MCLRFVLKAIEQIQNNRLFDEITFYVQEQHFSLIFDIDSMFGHFCPCCVMFN